MGTTPKDPDAKVRLGYTDPGSVVWADGREWLRNADWRRRVDELRERSGGFCEWRYTMMSANDPVERCSSEAADPHHIIKRSVLRDDRLSNLQALCRYHHDLLDNRKIRSDRAETKNG
jgi:hypothetical protein